MFAVPSATRARNVAPVRRFSCLARLTIALAGVLLAASSCTEDEAQFSVKHAPGYNSSGAAISVLGIFKDGRMSPESWDQLGVRFSAPFNAGGACQGGYSNAFVNGNPTLSAALDDYARANGITDELLAELAPAARGDAILVITVAGHPPRKLTPDGGAAAPTAATAPPTGGGMRGGRSRGGGSLVRNVGEQSDKNVFEVEASLYSVKEQKSVAVVSMRYTGPSAEDGLKKFVERLGATVPGASCGGWSWDTKLDEGKIGKMADEQ